MPFAFFQIILIHILLSLVSAKTDENASQLPDPLKTRAVINGCTDDQAFVVRRALGVMETITYIASLATEVGVRNNEVFTIYSRWFKSLTDLELKFKVQRLFAAMYIDSVRTEADIGQGLSIPQIRIHCNDVEQKCGE